jgi:hypothetical protein
MHRCHPVAPELGQLVERIVIEGDQFAQASSAPESWRIESQWFAPEMVPQDISHQEQVRLAAVNL